MDSIWVKTDKEAGFRCLHGNIKADVLIIGGGMAGLMCAYELNRAGVDCVLVEADKVCGGITKNTTAKVTSLHGLIYDKIIKKYGVDSARLYFEANQAAVERYKELSQEIDCDFEERPAFVYSLKDRQNIEDEVRAIERIGGSADFTLNSELPFEIAGAVKLEGQAQFHPLKFIRTLTRGLHIYEHTKVLEIRDKEAVTNRGRIRADKIIVATHFPFINKHGAYFLKLYQHRTYVLALNGAQAINGMYVDEDEKGLSFRSYGNLLLLGGGSHRTGKRGGSYRELSDFARRYYPEASEAARWATQDCMSLDGMPYIGQYSSGTPNMYVVSGFNKWGMTSAAVAARVLCDLVQGRDTELASLFSPSRRMLHPQLFINLAESALGLITPTTPRCPHLGCALKYNAAEHTWDCPCHGSRFGEDGTLIDNPANCDNPDLKER